jgi:6-phosphogluconolactonase
MSTAMLLQETVELVLMEKGLCDVMLTGGRSAEKVYKAWGELPEFGKLKNVSFYFSDERCVPPECEESNYGLAMRTLFRFGLPNECTLVRMEADQENRCAAALNYERLMPDKIDVLLLSMGEDGHVASLFPHHEALKESKRRVIPVFAPKPPQERLTVTRKVLEAAVSKFVLCIGVDKASRFEEVILATTEISELPACLVLNSTWILDAPVIIPEVKRGQR